MPSTRLITVPGAVEITVEDLARAWASIDGKRAEFAARGDDGHYEGYLAEAEEQVKRAISYAQARSEA